MAVYVDEIIRWPTKILTFGELKRIKDRQETLEKAVVDFSEAHLRLIKGHRARWGSGDG